MISETGITMNKYNSTESIEMLLKPPVIIL